MALSHNLGFPRIGASRELKFSLESFWRGDSSVEQLEHQADSIKLQNWGWQQQAGLDLIPVGDFAYYDHILQLCLTFDVIPNRHRKDASELEQLFNLARGATDCCGKTSAALEMTKWFDTNYHYLVPELAVNQTFNLKSRQLINDVVKAKVLGHDAKPVVVGPLTFLWLSKCRSVDEAASFDKLSLLPSLLAAYQQLLNELSAAGADWVQIDEPILSLDLPEQWVTALAQSYAQLKRDFNGKILLANYFGGVAEKLEAVIASGVDGLHIDAVRAADEVIDIATRWPEDKVLSVGVIDGRNVWRADLSLELQKLTPLHEQRGDRLWIAPSCSLMHVPVDADVEHDLDEELKGWLAFARQKLNEIGALTRALNGCQSFTDRALFTDSDQVQRQKAYSPRILNLSVRQRAFSVLPEHCERKSDFVTRINTQQAHLALPAFPTTTIGSFPQTPDIRKQRAAFRAGKISAQQYDSFLEKEVIDVVKRQDDMGLDVLVHGEPERNDMVEFFGELLDGIAVSRLGWVQSYGSRCVKPPLIYGDVSRPEPMTVRWSEFAQAQTTKPMKGMLTGPVTILNWSFVRSDLPRSDVAQQIALTIRDEVKDLERIGLKVIQIDEPALREGLPLRTKDWDEYLSWAVDAFKLSAAVVKDETQIHTHMCYCEFEDIMQSIADLDADVISIEASRSGMELLQSFDDFEYPNAIGLGVYDIHSPNIPSTGYMVEQLNKALECLPLNRIWVNPDCGLKTRGWPETTAALTNMVEAAKHVRVQHESDIAQFESNLLETA
ncbi:5-methyltetrahydropteroyltriglutamate--homocysteine S-methyltransferase [Echinimonas agarilytica]|uniref:5-methyltetrahydropteroyltriglutamate--homocysteine methyltransferase n=1 Tax=Echinimonas agarilytica TaxID=1215918 RepID=A0AA41W8C7_9GAMM|nr:5-methyltetrahydropteroyltriglutamate--homocysteine S-methyltransferase [Echinimonas agarilytica]MCM2680503.1 5-methyltetrahydropteroyltriglutamate--homocysteine S-methyltransferase [Echinimonas agarilytica]